MLGSSKAPAPLIHPVPPQEGTIEPSPPGAKAMSGILNGGGALQDRPQLAAHARGRLSQLGERLVALVVAQQDLVRAFSRIRPAREIQGAGLARLPDAGAAGDSSPAARPPFLTQSLKRAPRKREWACTAVALLQRPEQVCNRGSLQALPPWRH